jgi:3-polyprenyl-4-hydroxybenzoate decarboxylase
MRDRRADATCRGFDLENMLALSRMGVIIAPLVADERPSMMSNFVGSGL